MKKTKIQLHCAYLFKYPYYLYDVIKYLANIKSKKYIKYIISNIVISLSYKA